MPEPSLYRIVILAISLTLSASTTFAQQGAVRLLYTVPNTAFIEQPTGERVVMINDTSGDITTLQTAIDNARSANPDKVIVIQMLKGATYSVSSAGLVLGSHECLVAQGALIQATDSSVTVPLVTIAANSTNVSISGGTLDGQGANIQGIFAPAASRVNIDKVVVKNFGLDGILLIGRGNSSFDDEMTVTRCDVSASAAAGIDIQNSTQTTLLDNNCHDSTVGIWLSCAWANIANNTCHDNATGIVVAGGSDNVITNNTCNNNGVGIDAAASDNMIVSNSIGNNSTAGILSHGTSNTFVDNLFTGGNSTNFASGGNQNSVIAYQAPIAAPGQNYFYPPLVDNPHTDPIVNGMGRTDLAIDSTTIDDVQSQYNAARTASPNDVIVLHLNGTFTVGANPLMLSSNTSVLLTGTIQINSSTRASAAIASSGQTRISISGGTIDGGNQTRHHGINLSNASMVQVDGMTIQNFGNRARRVGGSDLIAIHGGHTPYVVTRCLLQGGAARGIWTLSASFKSLITNNDVSNVNQDGLDNDASTRGCVATFNYFHDNVRYGHFIEQSASHNLSLGNVCNNNGRDINLFNNSATPRGATAFNSIICNACRGGNGIRNGSTSVATVRTSHNFFFNNAVTNASIQSGQFGEENYYSQTFLAGGRFSMSGSGVETFFNSANGDGNLQVLDSNSGLGVVVRDASTSDGAPIVTAQPSPLGNGLDNDEWRFIPTDSGYYAIRNKNSGLVLAVQGAALTRGTPIVQSAYSGGNFNDEWLIQPVGNGLYNFVNRLSGLYLDVRGGSHNPGTQLIQWTPDGGANQQFSLVQDAPPGA